MPLIDRWYDCLALTQFNNFNRSFRGGLRVLIIFQVWVSNPRLTCCSCSSDHFVVLLFVRPICGQRIFQQAPGPPSRCLRSSRIFCRCLTVLNQLNTVVSICTGFEGPPVGEDYAVAPPKFRKNSPLYAHGN